MNDEERKTALNQVKQLCDFMLDETDTVKFEQTGEECLQMIKCLVVLRKTAELFLQREVLGVLSDEDLY